MIFVGGNRPHAYLETSHISTPERSFGFETAEDRKIPYNYMRKARAVYVGEEHVYPARFRYTFKYRHKVNFTYTGNSHGILRPSYGWYAEIKTDGFVEDTVRIDTMFPVYYHVQPLVQPDEYFKPASEDDAYDHPPYGFAEQYPIFTGFEYLLMPSCALTGAVPDTGTYWGSSWGYGEGIYAGYTEDWRFLPSPVKMAYRYILERKVSSSTVFTDKNKWDSDEDCYDLQYTLKQRRTVYPYSETDSLFRGWYANTSNRAASMPIGTHNPLTLGFTYREENPYGDAGLFIMTDLEHYNYSDNVLLGKEGGRGFEFPGNTCPHLNTSFSLKAPMFSGRKHFDVYDTTWNVGRTDLSGWDDPNVDTWSHTDLTGSFMVMENNNPSFGSIDEYINAYLEA